MFKAFKPQQSIPQTEQEILELWEREQTFSRSIEQRQGQKPFVFYEGPPTANGKPGIHHVMARTFKDVICRYQTMKGRYVLRKAGWDTHGLPVELQVEKALGLKNKSDIEGYGVAEFNAKCRESVWQYKDEWEKLTKRMGYWVDLDHPYVTYETDYIESVWWAFKQIWEKGLVYQDYKVIPYCPRCGTALSLAEVAQGYKEVTETSVYIKFKVEDESDAYILAWTTTPWTLPGNVALAVGDDIDYCKIKQGKDIYYIAKERLAILEGDYQVLDQLKGSQLVGRRYRPLFNFLDLGKETGKDAYKVLAGDFVTTDDGTGVVHTAVMYGEEDFNLGKAADLPAKHTVDEKGEFNELVPNWQGRFVKDAEKDIIEYLKEQGSLYKTEQTLHTYPFCWRCSTHLLYYARNSWFIQIDDSLRHRLVELNKDVKWVPEYIRDGRFGNWLEGLRDWAISRDRYWGTPLPIWQCQNDPQHKHCLGSLEELEAAATPGSQQAVTQAKKDLHRPYIDDVLLTCPDCQGTMKRVPQVLDVWFDSGAMPYAQWHYPFENQERFAEQFPADYISEGIDQTRGWFNSLLIIAALLKDERAYKAVICGNLLLDEHGQKMSKSKGNVVNPWDVIEETGIDALRFFFLSVNQPGDNKNFSMKAIQEVYRKNVMIFWNVTSFFLTYASVDGWQPHDTDISGQTILDRWLTARLNQATQKIDTALADFDTFTASRTLSELIDDLSTWYLRRSRKRRDASFYRALHQALVQTALLAAPMMPFLAEAIYQAVRTDTMPQSVHLADYPVGDDSYVENDQELLASMAVVRRFVTLGHSIRAEQKIKVRQPLGKAIISSLTSDSSLSLDPALLEIIADELNIKTVETAAQIPSDWHTSQDDAYQIALDPTLTPALREEGQVRELIREIQEFRKKSGCRPGQIVELNYYTESLELRQLIEKNRAQLLEEVTAKSFVEQPNVESITEQEGQTKSQIALNDQELTIGLVHVE